MSDSMMAAGFIFLSLVISVTPFIACLFILVRDLFVAGPWPSVPGMVFMGIVVVTCATLEVVVYASRAVFVCLVQVTTASTPINHDAAGGKVYWRTDWIYKPWAYSSQSTFRNKWTNKD